MTNQNNPNNQCEDAKASRFDDSAVPKSVHAIREEKILTFWKEKGIFDQTLKRESPKGEFIFYEGPPTANGHPGIHHLEARAFKDAIPRYKTMRGYHVRRKGGWDTHGLPVELQVEKELNIRSKKEIESYGVGAFNQKCKESVWRYVREWADFTSRMGYWVDLNDPYITYRPKYIEAVWSVIKTADQKKLLYKDYKVVPWCPRCGTGLSSHELAQGYETVKDISLYVKFKIKDTNTYLLAWTTTPWTLPGNVALAVNQQIEYCKVEIGTESYILAKSRLVALKGAEYTIVETFNGSKLVGLTYEPPYPFMRDAIDNQEKLKLPNAFRVYAAPFVTTEDGTGIVHIAAMYGQDDFDLGTRVGLPKYHLVNDDGTFKKEAGFLSGAFVKDPNTDIAIIKDLSGRGILFAKEKVEHTYPSCWRCHTPLIYFARDSWYIEMSGLRDKLVKENEGIHWEPEYIRAGRFGEWLREVKDWAISRERYWGTPLPVWVCDACHSRKVVGSVKEIAREPRNKYFVMRHGEAGNNTADILDAKATSTIHLTKDGIRQVMKSIGALKSMKIDLIISSPVSRTRETANLVREGLGLDSSAMLTDDRLIERGVGIYDGRSVNDFKNICAGKDRWAWRPEGGENFTDIRKRMGGFIYDIDEKFEGRNILIITHEIPASILRDVAIGLEVDNTCETWPVASPVANAEIRSVDFSIIPHNENYELDLHRPFLDQVMLPCKCGATMRRVKEIMDVWFDSGSMPFAQDHELGDWHKLTMMERLKIGGKRTDGYPADFIAEAIDQTRGWFYTLHAIGVIMGRGKAYKNVICLGHILDNHGKKMSKSLGNIVNPWDMMNKYGADALRFWMYSINQPGDSKNFEEKTVDEITKKVFNLVSNVLTFYKLYEGKGSMRPGDTDKYGWNTHDIQPSDILDRWIVSRTHQLIAMVTSNLDNYKFIEPTRAIRDFAADLSQWYIRRSRDRFKFEGTEKQGALATTRYVLSTLAKIMAPFTPFFAEYIFQELHGDTTEGPLSVHLESWPEAGEIDERLLKNMQTVREISSKGLEARMNAKINVRQPLQEMRVKRDPSFALISESGSRTKAGADELSQLIDLIKDEVNVKEVEFDGSTSSDVELDTTITAILKEEGMTRELIRVIQDLRKEKGLTVSDTVELKIDTSEEGQKFVENNRAEISAATLLDRIIFTGVSGEQKNIGGITMKIGI